LIRFTVLGTPQPAGSKTAYVRGGKAVVTDASKKSRPWKHEVKVAAMAAIIWDDGDKRYYPPPLEGPLMLSLRFYVQRPKSHHGKRGLRPSAPAYPTTRPDVLKLARGVEDALTGICYRDDSQIVVELLSKHYGDPPRVEVEVEQIAATISESASEAA
jgi:Holliday junction resolvase RusA-like endonuclease